MHATRIHGPTMFLASAPAPLPATGALGPPVMRRAAIREELPPWRFLVVEDSVDLAVVLERVLRRIAGNCQIDWETRASAGALRLRTRTYDLVLADYFLDGPRSGLWLYDECLRSQQGVVFAMMSSLRSDSFLALAGGRPIPFLPKPFTVRECREFITGALGCPSGGANDATD